MKEKLFTAHEVSQELGVTHACIRMMIMRGAAHAEKLGKFHVFTQAELDRLRNRPARRSKKAIAKK